MTDEGGIFLFSMSDLGGKISNSGQRIALRQALGAK